MRFIAFLIFLSYLIQPQLGKSQVVDEIKAYIDSNELIIDNGRKLMVEKINNNDYQKAKEIYEYLNQETQSTRYKAFSYNEHLYFNIIVNDWDKLLALFKNIETEKRNINYYNPYSLPLASVLYDMIVDSIDPIENKINLLDVANEDKEILLLYLSLLKKDYGFENYNSVLSSFQKKYKPSRYDAFIKDYLPRKFVRLYMNFSFGTNITFPTSKIKEEFTPSPPGFNVSVDFTFGRFYSSLFVMISDFELKSPFNAIVKPDTLSFQKNDRFTLTEPGLKTGYHLTKTNKIQIVPYVLISGNTLESTLYMSEKEGEEYKIIDSFGYGFGSQAELRLLKFSNAGYYSSIGTSYLGLRIDGGYTFIANHRNGYSGNVPYIKFSLTWGFGAYDF